MEQEAITPEKIRAELGGAEQALIEARAGAARNFEAAANLLQRRYEALISMLREAEQPKEAE